jgi:hypothetical protein
MAETGSLPEGGKDANHATRFTPAAWSLTVLKGLGLLLFADGTFWVLSMALGMILHQPPAEWTAGDRMWFGRWWCVHRSSFISPMGAGLVFIGGAGQVWAGLRLLRVRSARRATIMVAVAVALAILAGSGIGYWVLSHHLAALDENAPLPYGGLERLPLRLGEWEAQDVDDSWVDYPPEITVLTRRYTKRTGAWVWLGIEYGVRRQLLGWPGYVRHDEQSAQLPLSDGSKLPCLIYRFSEGAPGGSGFSIRYCILDGEPRTGVPRLRWIARLGSGGVRYLASVSITSSGSSAESEDWVRTFAADSASAIRAIMPRGNR